MKYIKEYSEHSDPTLFNPEDIQYLKDVYFDIIEELNLYDNPFHILNANDATFQVMRMYNCKMCKIFIRTLVSNHHIKPQSTNQREFLPSDEEMSSNHHRISELLKPHLERIKNMGYMVRVENLLGAGNIINGLIVVITKKPS